MRIKNQAIVTLIFAMLYALPVSASPDIDFPMNGQSYGGKVRSGPGMSYGQAGSLREGDPILILNDTGVVMNGYNWFHISYRNGRRGYQWGGIICSERAYNGIFRQCSSRQNNGNNNANNNPDNNGVNGFNVTDVEHSRGAFISNGNGTWIERGNDGSTFNFDEQQRDEWSVYLFDRSRNVSLQLDLFRKLVLYAQGNAPKRSLYQIIRASAGNIAPQRPRKKVNRRADTRRCGRNAYRTTSGKCRCKRNYEFRSGRCQWRIDKRGFEKAPWKKPGCKKWLNQCNNGNAAACRRHEETCQVN